MSDRPNHGGDLIAKGLKEHGVKYVFTLTGGHISPILTGCERIGIDVVDVRNEATAVFAADAVSRLSGIPGVAVVTAGPGVTNTITPLKNAQMAQSPVILFGGATALVLKGRGSLQDIDQHAIVKSIVKWQTTVKRVKDIPNIIAKAFYEALSGTPGPVFVEVPIDTLYPEPLVRELYGIDQIKGNSLNKRILRYYLKRQLNSIFRGADFEAPIKTKKPAIPVANDKDIRKAKLMLTKAQRPLIVVGSQAMLNHPLIPQLRKGIEELELPVYLSGMARGLMGANHPFQFRHKRRRALKEADLIILLGVPLDFRLDYGRQFGRHTKVVSISRSKSDLNLNRLIRKIDLKIHGDPADAFVRIVNQPVDQDQEIARSYTNSQEMRSEWLEILRNREDSRNKEIVEMAGHRGEKVNPLHLCRRFEDLLPENSILIGDGGDFIATFSYVVQPRAPLSWLDPGVFGTLGSGGGFALGAKKVFPDKDVFLIYGDGSFGYSLSEWDTYKRHSIPIFGLIGNDAEWAQIAREQTELLGSDVATKLSYTNYDKAVHGIGGAGFLIKSDEEVMPVLKEAMESLQAGNPTLVNAFIAKSDFRKGSISM